MTKEVGEVEVILSQADAHRIVMAGILSPEGQLALRLAVRQAEADVLVTLEP